MKFVMQLILFKLKQLFINESSIQYGVEVLIDFPPWDIFWCEAIKTFLYKNCLIF